MIGGGGGGGGSHPVIIQNMKCLLYSYFYGNLRLGGGFLTFRGPYIVIYSYNKSQRNALILICHDK